MAEIIYGITGLSEYRISFENYCVACKIQGRCKYGKKEPFNVIIDCHDILDAYEKKRFELMKKAQKEADIEDTYEQIAARVKVNMSQIFSGLWNEKIKKFKEEILCLDSRRIDSLLTAQRGGEWWSGFRSVMKKIYEECKKQTSLA